MLGRRCSHAAEALHAAQCSHAEALAPCTAEVACSASPTCRRQSEAEAKTREVRLTRALEEIERYKALLQEQRTADRDVKDGAKAEHTSLLTGGLCCTPSPGQADLVRAAWSRNEYARAWVSRAALWDLCWA